MTENFAELFEESIKALDVTRGSVISGTIVAIDDDWITVNAGLKSEGVIAKSEFLTPSGEIDVAVGDDVDVVIDAIDDGLGFTRLSREKAKRAEAWKRLETIHEEQTVVIGIINGKVKGGFTVDVEDVRAFLPGSLVDVRPLRDTSHLEGKELEFKVIKLDPKRNNVVVSRRAVMDSENSVEREALLESLTEGAEAKGIVKNLTDYGAFVDLGGIDGLLHITDMAWKRIKHPSEIVEVGQEINVKILKFDKEKKRVSLGLKQLGEDPWSAMVARFPEGSIVKASITNLTDYGCFAELEEGVEGLVHVSEMDWTNKNIHPSKVVNVGDELDVMILDIDQERRRISLGIKQCKPNPWDEFATAHQKGDKISGTIKSITDFGVFIGLEGGIDGLVHLSDLSWDETGEDAVRNYKKGDELETIILSVDSERERISLGVKQINSDPFTLYVDMNEKGSIVKGTVLSVDAQAAIVELAEGVEASLKAADISTEKVTDAASVLKNGDEVEGKIVNVDKKNRTLTISIKARDVDDEKEAIKGLRNQEAAPAKTLGDLIKAQMDENND